MAWQGQGCVVVLGLRVRRLCNVDAESDSDVLSDSELSLDESDSDSESELESLDE